MSTLDKAIKTCDDALAENAYEMLSLARKLQNIDEEIENLKKTASKISKDFNTARNYVMSHSKETTPEITSKVKEAVGIRNSIKNNL